MTVAVGFSVVVYGDPIPQGSKTMMKHRYSGKPIMKEDNKRLGPWREAIATAARIEATADPGWEPLDGSLLASMVFTLARPRSHYRTGRFSGCLRDDAPPRPAAKPDLDKLARGVCDALKIGRAIVDDARIVEFGRLAKVWAREDPDALNVPGLRVAVGPYQQQGRTLT